MFELCRSSNIYFLFTIVTTVLGAILLLVQVAAGIGLSKMSPRGRKLVLVYALVMAVVSNVLNGIDLLPVMSSHVATQAADEPPGARKVMGISLPLGRSLD